jgi:outer membrane receptor for ferric coprogen and ferric-rhodotorulic acid
MKIKVLSIALIGAAVLATSCNKKAEETTEPAVEEVADTTAVAEPSVDTTATVTAPAGSAHKDGEVVEVTGKVTEINQGKDGYTAKITTADAKAYSATISIPNLDNPKQYRAVKIGDNITVKGEVTNLESEVLIRVKELK